MRRLVSAYEHAVAVLSGRVAESIALLATRTALAGIFWRSGRSKVVDGSVLEISDATRHLLEYEYVGVPLPTYAEHFLPILLIVGLGTRFAALGLWCMTMVIQIFVFPEAWWSVHLLWAALAAVLISRGGGLFALDVAIARGLPGTSRSPQRWRNRVSKAGPPPSRGPGDGGGSVKAGSTVQAVCAR